MEITYLLTPEDMWAFQQFHARRKPLARLLNGFGNLVFALAWLTLLWTNVRRLLFWQRAFHGYPGAWQLYWSFHHTSLLSFLFFTALAAYFLCGARLLFLRRVAGAQVFHQPITMHLYPDAVLVTTATQQSRLPWADVREVAASRHHLFFYNGPATAVIVPKRAFAAGLANAFQAAALAFKSDPQASRTPEAASGVWPPPPVRPDAPAAPVMEEVPDPPGTVEIAYVTRRADAWRSAGYNLLVRPGTILSAAVPLLLSAFYIAFTRHAGPVGYGLAFLVALLVTTLLIVNQVRAQLATRFPDRDSARACVSKIRPDAYVDISPNGRTVLPWHDVGAISLAQGDLHLHRRDGQGTFFIPRSAFQTPADARAARDAMRRCQQQAQSSPAAPSVAR